MHSIVFITNVLSSFPTLSFGCYSSYEYAADLYKLDRDGKTPLELDFDFNSMRDRYIAYLRLSRHDTKSPESVPRQSYDTFHGLTSPLEPTGGRQRNASYSYDDFSSAAGGNHNDIGRASASLPSPTESDGIVDASDENDYDEMVIFGKTPRIQEAGSPRSADKHDVALASSPDPYKEGPPTPIQARGSLSYARRIGSSRASIGTAGALGPFALPHVPRASVDETEQRGRSDSTLMDGFYSSIAMSDPIAQAPQKGAHRLLSTQERVHVGLELRICSCMPDPSLLCGPFVVHHTLR